MHLVVTFMLLQMVRSSRWKCDGLVNWRNIPITHLPDSAYSRRRSRKPNAMARHPQKSVAALAVSQLDTGGSPIGGRAACFRPEHAHFPLASLRRGEEQAGNWCPERCPVTAE
jgi:hypothetical protein